MAATPRGHIEQLPSGSFRVHVYAGTGPVTGKPRRIRETCPDNATAAATLGRLLAEVDQGRFPVDELRLTLCSTLSERTSAYGFKAAPKGRSRRRPSLSLLPAKTPVGWREEIMTGVA